MTISPNDYFKAYQNIYSHTNIAKLRSFQYRLLAHALVLNKYLYYCKIKDSSMCAFCHLATEIETHLFFDCDIVSNFIHKVYDSIKEVVPHIATTLEPVFKVKYNFQQGY